MRSASFRRSRLQPAHDIARRLISGRRPSRATRRRPVPNLPSSAPWSPPLAPNPPVVGSSPPMAGGTTPKARRALYRAGRNADRLPEQFLQGPLRILAEAGVDGGDLDDRAARGDQPVEALAQREPGDGPAVRASGVDPRDGREVLADELDVHLRPEGQEAPL